MKSLKKAVVTLVSALVLTVGVSGAALAASPSAQLTSISKATVCINSTKYNGKTQKAKIVVLDEKGNVLKENVDYKVSKSSYKHSGTYTITITGIGHYKGKVSAKYTIKGTASASKNKITAKAKKSSVKAKTVKKKSQKIKITVKKNKAFKGKVTYKVTKYPKKAKKYISVSKKGVVTLKKGAKKGTYKIKVSVAGYKGYSPKTKTITIKVK